MVGQTQLDIGRRVCALTKVIFRKDKIGPRTISHTMSSTINFQVACTERKTDSMHYTHCKTQVISLVDLNIPDSATEAEYKQLYNSISQSKTSVAQRLTDAVSSISLGIAPPVAFPTETVYGLGADATNLASIAGIFAAKGRPSDNPLIVHVASTDHLERLTGEPIPAIYSDLVKQHWPGPLTILVPIPDQDSPFAQNVHPGQKTIGFRVPQSKYARFFIAATGKPIAAPSANSSGKPSPTTAQHVMNDLRGKVNFILDGGNCDVGVESTVVDGLHDPPLILRPGGLSQDDLIAHGKKFNNAWANVRIGYKQTHTTENGAASNGDLPKEAPRAPGMKYKHYAPQGQMILFEGLNSSEKVMTEIDRFIDALDSSTVKNNLNPTVNGSDAEPPSIAILTSTSWPAFAGAYFENGTSSPTDSSKTYRAHTVHTIHLGRTPTQIAQNLFAALRTCDDLRCRFILAEAPSRDECVLENGESSDDSRVNDLVHEFDTVLERMRKAASMVVS